MVEEVKKSFLQDGRMISQKSRQMSFVFDWEFLNVFDVVIMVNIILSEDCPFAADMNSDTFCNVLDIVQLVNLILPD